MKIMCNGTYWNCVVGEIASIFAHEVRVYPPMQIRDSNEYVILGK